MAQKTMCSIISSWTLKSFCQKNGIHPENLSDFTNAIDRMMTQKKIEADSHCKIFPVAVKGAYYYHIDESESFFTLINIGQVNPDFPWPKAVYDVEKLGSADCIELWQNPSSHHPNMVARIIGEPKVNGEYFCLTKYSVFFELPAEQVWHFSHFLKTESPLIGHLLGTNN
ncbi:hypothetical protein J6X09_01570 [Candidatus Saccharibacteria bacterium]|nr:hypothetical protein [Candidatus Saccharibacteria bacterium]